MRLRQTNTNRNGIGLSILQSSKSLVVENNRTKSKAIKISKQQLIRQLLEIPYPGKQSETQQIRKIFDFSREQNSKINKQSYNPSNSPINLLSKATSQNLIKKNHVEQCQKSTSKLNSYKTSKKRQPFQIKQPNIQMQNNKQNSSELANCIWDEQINKSNLCDKNEQKVQEKQNEELQSVHIKKLLEKKRQNGQSNTIVIKDIQIPKIYNSSPLNTKKQDIQRQKLNKSPKVLTLNIRPQFKQNQLKSVNQQLINELSNKKTKSGNDYLDMFDSYESELPDHNHHKLQQVKQQLQQQQEQQLFKQYPQQASFRNSINVVKNKTITNNSSIKICNNNLLGSQSQDNVIVTPLKKIELSNIQHKPQQYYEDDEEYELQRYIIDDLKTDIQNLRDKMLSQSQIMVDNLDGRHNEQNVRLDYRNLREHIQSLKNKIFGDNPFL